MDDIRPEFDVSELAKRAGVTPRTIYYYAQQGLIPPAAGAGPGPKYGRGHLVRLRLVKRLQREHLPLAEIARRLKLLSDEQVEKLLAETPGKPPAQSSALEYVRSVLRKSDRGPAQEWAGETGPSYSRWLSEREPGLDALAEQPMVALIGPPDTPSSPPSSGGREEQVQRCAPQDRSQWERITLADNFELHIRRPMTREQQKALERLLAAASQILRDT